MKTTYPIIIHPKGKEDYHFIEIPDFDGFTQGKNLNECLEMAADYINLCVIDLEDANQPVPTPSALTSIQTDSENILTLVPIDTILYRQQTSSKPVKKTLTIPTWLNKKAEQNNINFSKTLQEALIEKLYQ